MIEVDKLNVHDLSARELEETRGGSIYLWLPPLSMVTFLARVLG